MNSWNYEGRYLDQFPNERHGFVTNLFCFAYRANQNYAGYPKDPAADTNQMLERLRADIAERLQSKWIEQDTADVLTLVMASLGTDEARNFAKHIFQREQIAPELKAKLKSESAKVYVEKAMEVKPPSEKQLKLMRAKGWTGDAPASMREASKIIDSLLNK